MGGDHTDHVSPLQDLVGKDLGGHQNKKGRGVEHFRVSFEAKKQAALMRSNLNFLGGKRGGGGNITEKNLGRT